MPREQLVAKLQTINAPAHETAYQKSLKFKSVFLAGTTSGLYDWRAALVEQLANQPIIVFNPIRRDWDASWIEDISCAPFKEQTEWELEKQEKSDVIAVYFGAGTDAPISLLELGLCAKDNKAVVCIQDGYKKKGNVQVVCERYNIKVTNDLDGFCDGIKELLDR